MNKKVVLALFLFLIIIAVVAKQELRIGSVKIWHETSVADFVDGSFDDTIVEELDGGQIRLLHPMQPMQSDSAIFPRPRFVVYDSAGNYFFSWVDSRLKNVYLRKYNANNEIIKDSIQVNDISGYCREQSYITMMQDSNRIIVVWNDTRNSEQTIYGEPFAQIFDSDLNPIGLNNQISTKKSVYSPAVAANPVDGMFWIFFSGPATEAYRVNIQKINANGSLIGSSFPVIPLNNINLKTAEAVDVRKDGITFVVSKNAAGVSNLIDLYITKLSLLGEPLAPTIKINDDIGDYSQNMADMAMDPTEGFLIVWCDGRNNGNQFPFNSNVYGQYFDSSGSAIGENFLVSRLTAQERTERYPDVEWKKDKFVVTWTTWNNDFEKNDRYQNSWRYIPVIKGCYTSSVFDIGPDLGNPETILWQGFTRIDTNVIKFQLRSAIELDSLFLASWQGPADSVNFYMNSSGDSINPVHHQQRYLQYRAYLETAVIGKSPILNEVNIFYTSCDTIAPAPPRNLLAEAGHSRIALSWNANLESDLMSYKIYRSPIYGDFSSGLLTTVLKPDTTFIDTSAVTGINYYYVIAAVDSNLNVSSFSNQVTATAFGAVLYIDAQAAAGGDGSKQFPFKKIQEGINTAFYGDTVLALPGTYHESLMLKVGVIVKGSGAKVTAIHGRVNGQESAIIIGANEAVLHDFTIIYPGTPNSRPAILCSDCGMKILNNICNRSRGY